MKLTRARFCQFVWQVVRFCISGGAGVIVFYTTLWCLTEYLKVWYIASTIIGWFMNTAVNFVLQKFWAFQNKDTRIVHRQLVLYFGTSVCVFIANLRLLYLMVERWHMYYIVAQAILTVVFSILSFVVTKKIFTNERSTVCPKPPSPN